MSAAAEASAGPVVAGRAEAPAWQVWTCLWIVYIV